MLHSLLIAFDPLSFAEDVWIKLLKRGLVSSISPDPNSVNCEKDVVIPLCVYCLVPFVRNGGGLADSRHLPVSMSVGFALSPTSLGKGCEACRYLLPCLHRITFVALCGCLPRSMLFCHNPSRGGLTERMFYHRLDFNFANCSLILQRNGYWVVGVWVLMIYVGRENHCCYAARSSCGEGKTVRSLRCYRSPPSLNTRCWFASVGEVVPRNGLPCSAASPPKRTESPSRDACCERKGDLRELPPLGNHRRCLARCRRPCKEPVEEFLPDVLEHGVAFTTESRHRRTEGAASSSSLVTCSSLRKEARSLLLPTVIAGAAWPMKEMRTTAATLPVHRAEKGRPSAPSAAVVHLPASTPGAGSRPSERSCRGMARRCSAASPPKRTESPSTAAFIRYYPASHTERKGGVRLLLPLPPPSSRDCVPGRVAVVGGNPRRRCLARCRRPCKEPVEEFLPDVLEHGAAFTAESRHRRTEGAASSSSLVTRSSPRKEARSLLLPTVIAGAAWPMKEMVTPKKGVAGRKVRVLFWAGRLEVSTPLIVLPFPILVHAL
nr:hypothetical protein Iba_chr08aCG11140 [Ipomoea batatas]